VTELRRLSGSSADLAPLLRWFEELDLVLVARDVGVERRTTDRRHTAPAVAATSSWEPRRLPEGAGRGREPARAQDRLNGPPRSRRFPVRFREGPEA
jgi:hypothetical protein